MYVLPLRVVSSSFSSLLLLLFIRSTYYLYVIQSTFKDSALLVVPKGSKPLLLLRNVLVSCFVSFVLFFVFQRLL